MGLDWSTQTVVLDTSRTYDRVGHASLLHKCKSNEVLSQIFGLVLPFLSNRRFRVALMVSC